jgi:ABC-type sulfate transport system permease subunit
MLLVFGMSLMAPLLAVFGLVDNWLDLRSRFPGRA